MIVAEVVINRRIMPNTTWSGCGNCKHREKCKIDNIYKCFNWELEDDYNEGLENFPQEHI
jgi:hypothetical protein